MLYLFDLVVINNVHLTILGRSFDKKNIFMHQFNDFIVIMTIIRNKKNKITKIGYINNDEIQEIKYYLPHELINYIAGWLILI